MATTITLKWEAICAECGASIPAGAQARYYGRGRAYGLTCHEKTPRGVSIPTGIATPTPTSQNGASAHVRGENHGVTLEPLPTPVTFDYPELRQSPEGVEIAAPDWPPTTQIKREYVAAHIAVALAARNVSQNKGRRGVSKLREELDAAQANAGRWTAWTDLDALRLSAMPALEQVDRLAHMAEEANEQALAADNQRLFNRSIRDTWGEARYNAGVKRTHKCDPTYDPDAPEHALAHRNAPGDLTAARQAAEETETYDNAYAAVLRAVNADVSIVPTPGVYQEPTVAPEEPLVTQAGIWQDKPLYATESEVNGVRESQAALAMGQGELATETAGPLFTQPVAA